MSLSEIGSVCSIAGLLFSFLSLCVTSGIAIKIFFIKNDFSDKNHHNQKVGGIGNSATYTNGK